MLRNSDIKTSTSELRPSLDPELGRFADRLKMVIGTMAFKREWLRRMGFEVKKLVLVTARGDSMVPTFADGDLLLVDLRQTDIVDGGVHILRNDGHLLAKRLQVCMGDQVIVRSDNNIYSAFDTKRDQLNVVGRVVWRGGRM